MILKDDCRNVGSMVIRILVYLSAALMAAGRLGLRSVVFAVEEGCCGGGRDVWESVCVGAGVFETLSVVRALAL